MSGLNPPTGGGDLPAAAGPRRVRKRSGRVAAYNPATIRRSLLRLTDSSDARSAEWVASWWEAFEAQLRRREEETLSTAEIHRILHEIIAASGQARLAERWLQYAQRKERLRARIAAQPQRLPGLESAGERIDRPIGFVRSEWLERLVRAGVAAEAAETISRDLAQLVIGLDPELVTAWLVAALLRSLCQARGISVLPADLPLAGVTPAELDAAYFGPGDVGGTSSATAEALAAPAPPPSPLWQESWALERFYAEEVRFFHRLGYWRLGLTEHPWGLWSLRVDTHRIGVQASRQSSPEGCGLHLARILCGLCDWTAATVTAQGVGDFIQRSYGQETLRAAALRAFCLALAALQPSITADGPARGRLFGRAPAKLVLRLGTPQHVNADEALLKQMHELGFAQFAGGVELELPPRALLRLPFQTTLFAAFAAGIPIRLTAARPAEALEIVPVGIRLNADRAASAAGALGSAATAPVSSLDGAAATDGSADGATAPVWDWAHEFFETNADDLVWALEAHRRLVRRMTGQEGMGTQFTRWAEGLGVLPYFQQHREWTLALMPAGLPDPLAGGDWDRGLWEKLAGLQERFAAWWGTGGVVGGSGGTGAGSSGAAVVGGKSARNAVRGFQVGVWPAETTGFGAGWATPGAAGAGGGEGAPAQGWSEAGLERLPGFLRQYAERAQVIGQTTAVNLAAQGSDSRMALEDGRTVLEFLAETWTQATVRIVPPGLHTERERFGRVYALEPLRLALEQRTSGLRLF